MSSPLHIAVTPGDELPIYRQIVRQVREAIASGRLAPGDRLPSHRELAARLVIAPLTVKKAYDELELAGLIETARGQGTFVREGVRTATARQRRETLRPAVRRLVQDARLADVDEAALLELLREELGTLLAAREGRKPIRRRP